MAKREVIDTMTFYEGFQNRVITNFMLMFVFADLSLERETWICQHYVFNDPATIDITTTPGYTSGNGRKERRKTA